MKNNFRCVNYIWKEWFIFTYLKYQVFILFKSIPYEHTCTLNLHIFSWFFILFQLFRLSIIPFL